VELKVVGVLGLIVVLGIGGGVLGYLSAKERNDRDAAKVRELTQAKTERDEAVRRGHAAELNELKARLAVASCDKSRANLEAALKEARAKWADR
jgi:hypothetical protein